MIVENCVSIDIDNIVRQKKLELLQEWKAKGLKLGKKELKHLVISRLEGSDICYKDSAGEISQELLVDIAPTNFGGIRVYFRCPLTTDGVFCGRQVRKLYLMPRDKYFGCRRCLGLTYLSCNRSHYQNRQYISRYRALKIKYEFLTRANKDSYLRSSSKRKRQLFHLVKEIEGVREVAFNQVCPLQ